MKYLVALFSTVYVLFSHSAAFAESMSGSPLFLEVGEQRTLSFPHLLKYSLSGTGSLRYVRLPGKDSILIKALKPGVSTLYVYSASGQEETHLIRVSGLRKSTYPETLLQALNLLKTSEVVDGGSHYLIRGQVRSANEARSIAHIRDHFPDQVIDETTRAPGQLEEFSKSLRPVLARYPGAVLEVTSGQLALHGSVPSFAAKTSLIKEARAIDPLILVDLQTMKDSDPTLFFKVFLLEVKKELILNLGISWPLNQPASLNLAPSPLFSLPSIDLSIQALAQKGLVRVLSSPELVVKAPGQAELFAGGELPFRTRSRYTDSILWKNVGLSLKLDVKEFGGDRVRLLIETEMSHLDGTVSGDDLPKIQTNRIKTLVDGTFGKPLLLSGLLQEDLRTQTQGLPGLGAIPILGKLFSSDDYKKSRSEFVAILLPERNLPSHPMERISSQYPRGYLPVPRHYVSEEEKEGIKSSPTYPWNAL